MDHTEDCKSRDGVYPEESELHIFGLFLLEVEKPAGQEQKKAEDVQLAFFRINAVAGFAVFCMILVGVYG